MQYLCNLNSIVHFTWKMGNEWRRGDVESGRLRGQGHIPLHELYGKITFIVRWHAISNDFNYVKWRKPPTGRSGPFTHHCLVHEPFDGALHSNALPCLALPGTYPLPVKSEGCNPWPKASWQVAVVLVSTSTRTLAVNVGSCHVYATVFVIRGNIYSGRTSTKFQLN